MTIDEIQKEKERLKRLVLSGLQEFFDATGLYVQQISIIELSTQTASQKLVSHDVKITVEL